MLINIYIQMFFNVNYYNFRLLLAARRTSLYQEVGTVTDKKIVTNLIVVSLFSLLSAACATNSQPASVPTSSRYEFFCPYLSNTEDTLTLSGDRMICQARADDFCRPKGLSATMNREVGRPGDSPTYLFQCT
jgi:hypothetical protein